MTFIERLSLKLYLISKASIRVSLFSFWHWLYWSFLIYFFILSFAFFSSKEKKVKKLFLDILANSLLFLLLSDYFIEAVETRCISVGRLPFHLCTLLGITIPITRFGHHFKKFKNATAATAVFAAFFYMVYPGTAINQNPFTYFPNQTVLYHTILFNYGLLSIVLGEVELDFFTDHKYILAYIYFSVGWAAIGNVLYPGCDYFFLEGSTLGVKKWITGWFILLAMPLALNACINLLFIFSKTSRVNYKEHILKLKNA